MFTREKGGRVWRVCDSETRIETCQSSSGDPKEIVEVGTAGQLNYVADNEGGIYTTMEALRRRGVSKLYIQAGYELHLD